MITGPDLSNALRGAVSGQRRDLAGVRDRLAIIAESETAPWLEPADGKPELDLLAAVQQRAVVYMRLDADRRMLLSEMLGAAIVGDLVTIAATIQHDPAPTVVVLDEFAALGARQIARLFGRGRSAGISLVLGTQELADLQAAGEQLRDQVLGNVEALIAHRQNVPESAELVSKLAGSRPAWITTQQTEQGPARQPHRRAWLAHPRARVRAAPQPYQAPRPGQSRGHHARPRPAHPTIAHIHHPRSAHDDAR